MARPPRWSGRATLVFSTVLMIGLLMAGCSGLFVRKPTDTKDTTAPTIANPSITPAFINASGTLILRVNVTDRGSGVATVKANCGTGEVTLTLSSGSTYTGTCTGIAGTDGAVIPQTVTFTAKDNAGNSSSNNTQSYKVDREKPTTTAVSGPSGFTNNNNPSFVFTASDGAGSGVISSSCTLSGPFSGNPVTRPCRSPVSLSAVKGSPLATDGSEDGAYSMSIRSTDNVGNVESTATYNWTYDSQPPETTIGSELPALTNNTSASFGFSGSDSGSGVVGYECKLDGGSFEPCTSPKNYTGLSEGNHAFQVRALDAAGNADPSPASSKWTIDTTSPDTTIISNPPTLTNSTSAGFEFNGSDTGSGVTSFECKLDSGSWASCTSPKSYTDLSDGSHTFYVRALDTAGNTDPSPASYTWTIDTQAPNDPTNVTSTSHTVNTPSNDPTIDMTWTAATDNGPAGVDGYAYTFNTTSDPTCDKTKDLEETATSVTSSSLGSGSYYFHICTVDNAGNWTATVTVGPYIIDVTPPEVSNDKSSQSVQYSDPIVVVTIMATDAHSSGSSLSASASGLPSGLSLTAGTNNGSSVPGQATWTVSGNIQNGPGTYTVTVTVTDSVGNSAFTSFTIIVTPEDARAEYVGTTFASTACATCSTATIALAATIRDITAVEPSSDPYAGNITYAKVRFINRDADTTLCTASVGAVPPGTTTGTATCNWSVNIGSADSAQYTVGIVVEGYYTRNHTSEDTVVTISKPQNDFVTGGGYIVASNSAGTYAATPGTKINFGFNVKYTKGDESPRGSVTIIVRSNSKVYRIKSTAINSLSVDKIAGTAQFNAQVEIEDATDSLNSIAIDSNATLILTMTDKGEPGSSDTIGITLLSGSGGLYFSSNWSGTQTIEQTLGGGNLVVH